MDQTVSAPAKKRSTRARKPTTTVDKTSVAVQTAMPDGLEQAFGGLLEKITKTKSEFAKLQQEIEETRQTWL